RSSTAPGSTLAPGSTTRVPSPITCTPAGRSGGTGAPKTASMSRVTCSAFRAMNSQGLQIITPRRWTGSPPSMPATCGWTIASAGGNSPPAGMYQPQTVSWTRSVAGRGLGKGGCGPHASTAREERSRRSESRGSALASRTGRAQDSSNASSHPPHRWPAQRTPRTRSARSRRVKAPKRSSPAGRVSTNGIHVRASASSKRISARSAIRRLQPAEPVRELFQELFQLRRPVSRYDEGQTGRAHHDQVSRPEQHDRPLVGPCNTVLRIDGVYVADAHVAGFIRLPPSTYCIPRANVVPLEARLDDGDVGARLEQPLVNAQHGSTLEEGPRVPALEQGEQGAQFGRVLLQLRQQRLHAPDEDAAVPQVGPAGEVLARRITVRLLDEVRDVERLR